MMPGLVAGVIAVSVGIIDPITHLGPVIIVGTPSSGPNLAKELALALAPTETTVVGALKIQNYFNNLALVLVTHIKLNAVVNTTDTGTAAVVSAPAVIAFPNPTPAAVTATGVGTVS